MIDGIISGKLLLRPKMMRTSRGSPYLIAKMRAFAYPVGTLPTKHLNADLIVFDKTLIQQMAACSAGEVLTVCGIITPTEETEFGIRQTVLKVTVKSLINGYLRKQQQGNGGLFKLIDRATGRK
ncbi:hypothetical protein L4G92_00230 [Neisseria sp. ZJ106]|uniref:Single-stranded DNA-binding protein n=1 Tax=Neisseria lisongii TaxID=2912188 RepID=A0AAW5ALB9_9NEIS|nr:hypothetical protein [Neisseria lisongii]MCF7520484.1 hypothetical protein [Neisseria lisongii]MCF7530321.1 hypothetical protein [Neisseria lisongii]WCL71574.1 hypothetical protein PJU73_00130 [Neisseria lisongii]